MLRRSRTIFEAIKNSTFGKPSDIPKFFSNIQELPENDYIDTVTKFNNNRTKSYNDDGKEEDIEFDYYFDSYCNEVFLKN